MDHALDAYDAGGFFHGNMSGYPSSLAPTVEDVTYMSTAILPET